MGSSFVGFDKTVEEETKRRRAIEQRRMQEILDGLARIEKAINAEVKRRIDASKGMRQGIENMMDDMLSRVQGRILDRFERLSGSMEELFERCGLLERGIQQFRGELPSKLQVDTTALMRQIRELGIELEKEKRHRADQDNLLLRMISEHEYSVDLRMEQELTQLGKRTETLQELIEDFASQEPNGPETATSRERILETIAQLKACMAEEARCREQTDDEVVQAINRYTGALHKNLRAANM